VGPDDRLHTRCNITCEEVARFCLDFLDGSLGQSERTAFETHLAECGECVGFFETYRKIPELSRQAISQEMPSGVKEAVRTFLRARYKEPAE
jgi:anti-sigma factor RsiW